MSWDEPTDVGCRCTACVGPVTEHLPVTMTDAHDLTPREWAVLAREDGAR